jgi:hypothetical protein
MLSKILFSLRTVVLAVGFGGGAVVGCSALIDVGGKQCEADSDCASFQSSARHVVCHENVCVRDSDPGTGGEGGGPATDDPLQCAARETSTASTVKYSFAPLFAPGAAPGQPEPFSIRACAQLDLTCDEPVFGPIDVNVGEPREFEVPTGFNGYFEITNPDTLGGLLFMGRPVIQDTVGWNITMPSPNLVAQLALVTGTTVDPELGIILTVARNCDGMALEGVSITNTKGGLGYYFVNFLPDSSLTQTGPQGAAGFANVPITSTILSGTHTSGKPLGPASVLVRPRWMSFVELWL